MKNRPKIEICGYCHKGFIPNDVNVWYCSESCGRLAERKLLRIGICTYCGKEFRLKGNTSYCSKACRDFHFLERKRRKCRNCGKEFIPDKHKYFYCSNECRDKIQKAYRSASSRKHYWLKQKIDKIDARIKYLERMLSKKSISFGKGVKKAAKKEIAALERKRESIIKRFIDINRKK